MCVRVWWYLTCPAWYTLLSSSTYSLVTCKRDIFSDERVVYGRLKRSAEIGQISDSGLTFWRKDLPKHGRGSNCWLINSCGTVVRCPVIFHPHLCLLLLRSSTSLPFPRPPAYVGFLRFHSRSPSPWYSNSLGTHIRPIGRSFWCSSHIISPVRLTRDEFGINSTTPYALVLRSASALSLKGGK